jgi:pimeloyl-ACP methyl ester carboxylesterase
MGAARRHRIESPLLAASCPVLVLRGPHDRIAPADWVATLARITAHGTAVTLAAGAHMVPLTEPEAVAACVARFLTNGSGRTAEPD